jgi:hypothetical protein
LDFDDYHRLILSGILREEDMRLIIKPQKEHEGIDEVFLRELRVLYGFMP